MLSNTYILSGTLLLLFWFSWWLGSVLFRFFGRVVPRSKISATKFIQPIPQKFGNFSPKPKFWKRKIQSLAEKFKKLIVYELSWAVLLLTLTNCTAICQTVTEPENKIDSVAFWLPYIVRDLKDYDLVKQKSYLQSEQIKGLQAISNAQKNISIRQNITLQSYSGSIFQLQQYNKTLKEEVKTQRKKLIKSRIENWCWRGGVLVGLFFIFR